MCPSTEPVKMSKYFVRTWWRHQMESFSPLLIPFLRGIHRRPVDCPHKGQWRGALIFSLICAWTNGWANTRDAGDLRRHCAHYDVTVIFWMVDTVKKRFQYDMTVLHCDYVDGEFQQGSLCETIMSQLVRIYYGFVNNTVFYRFN